jgi:hypothetical protein
MRDWLSFPQQSPHDSTFRQFMNRSEEVEQARFIKWTHKREVRALMPGLVWMFHSPNGGKRDAVVGGQMKAMGVKKGVPDLLMPVAATDYKGLAIEMKSTIGRTTPEQEDWLNHLTEQGWMCEVARCAEKARAITMTYFGVTDAPAIES